MLNQSHHREDDVAAFAFDVLHQLTTEVVISRLQGVRALRLDDVCGHQLNVWYSRLADEDRDLVNDVVDNAVHLAVFGLLVIMDGTAGQGSLGGRFLALSVVEPGGSHTLVSAADGAPRDFLALHDRYADHVLDGGRGKLDVLPPWRPIHSPARVEKWAHAIDSARRGAFRARFRAGREGSVNVSQGGDLTSQLVLLLYLRGSPRSYIGVLSAERLPGSAPPAGDIRRNRWYRGLPEHDQLHVRLLLDWTMLFVVLGWAAVLDGRTGPETVGQRLLLEDVEEDGRRVPVAPDLAPGLATLAATDELAREEELHTQRWRDPNDESLYPPVP